MEPPRCKWRIGTGHSKRSMPFQGETTPVMMAGNGAWPFPFPGRLEAEGPSNYWFGGAPIPGWFIC
jgi:hypothetical protein